MASRDLNDLHPDLLPLAVKFLDRLKLHDLDILVTCTYRMKSEQDVLYAMGRTKPGSIVTNARGGQSEHNYTINGHPASKAFDIVPLVGGKCIWDTNADCWKKIGELWSIGVWHRTYWLDWYGKKDAIFKEYPHFCLKVKE